MLLLSAAAALAGPRVAVDASIGVVPDMGGLGATLTQSGDIPIAGSTVASALYSTEHLLVSDQDSATLWQNSQQTGSIFSVLSEEPTLSGGLLGGEVGGRVRIELPKGPVFFQAGAHYSRRVSGGEQARTLGDIATASSQVAALLEASGLDPSDYVYGHLATTTDAAWLSIPLSVGLQSPQIGARTVVYGSAGVTVMTGGVSVTLDADERYANALTTHLDAEAGTATSYSPGAVTETLDFSGLGLGLQYGLGVQAGVSERVGIFIELDRSAASINATAPLSANGSRLLTAAQSEDSAVADPEAFSAISRSVTMNGASARIGARYYLW